MLTISFAFVVNVASNLTREYGKLGDLQSELLMFSYKCYSVCFNCIVLNGCCSFLLPFYLFFLDTFIKNIPVDSRRI